MHIMQNNWFLCLLCAYHNVPHVREYLDALAILKLNMSAFQRRVPIQNPIKIRSCGYLESFGANYEVIMSHVVAQNKRFQKMGLFFKFDLTNK